MRSLLASLVLLGSLTTAQADRATAKKLTDKAVKEHYKSGEWRAALEGYRAALTADPTFVTAHYYIASAASIIGDFSQVRTELKWMKASTDKEAVRLLKAALKDPDLDRASVDPEVRTLLALPPLDKLTPEQRLLERRGVWTVPRTGGCQGNYLGLTFKKGGNMTVRMTDDCAGDGLWYDDSKGTWTLAADGTLSLEMPGFTMRLTGNVLKPCPGGLPGACFTGKMVYWDDINNKESTDIQPEAVTAHRGLPENRGASDSKTRR